MDRDYVQEVERWRAARDRRLRSPDGWLALVGLEWLHSGDNAVGSDPGSDVLLPSASAPLAVGTIRVDGGRATFLPDAGGALELRDDRDDHPTVVSTGSLRWGVIWREGDLGVRIRDVEAPALTAFQGMRSWPVDPAWRVVGRFEVNAPGATVAMPTVLGREESYLAPGRVAFEVDGRTHRLIALQDRPGSDLFVIFGDRTNGRETYGGGRYHYAPLPDADGRVVLDFNKAYNPPCVFTPFATCALALPENRLPIRIEAGELAYEPAEG
jgi:uncharacterized protein (DUF1684 family)